MNIGVRAHDFGQVTAKELISRLSAEQVPCVQLAPYKALVYEEDAFTAAEAAATGTLFQQAAMGIDVLGCYINPIHPDQRILASQKRRFLDHIAFAKTMKAKLVGTETGSVEADFSYHPDNHTDQSYRKLLETLSVFAEEAERQKVFLGIEAVYDLVLYSPGRTLQMLKDLASPSVKIILDPVNLLHAGNYTQGAEVVREALSLYADKIYAVHVKDFTYDGVKREVPLGEGIFDYAAMVALLRAYGVQANLLLEGYPPQLYRRAKGLLLACMDQA